MPTPLPIIDRPIRLAVIGLGHISELVLPTYAARDDVEVVGLCDLDPARRQRWGREFPDALQTGDIDELLQIDADVVDVLVPTPAHAAVVIRVLEAGFHVQVQKPIARSLEESAAMVAAAARTGATLRVLEDYLFYPPLVKLRDVYVSGEIGDATGIHMKIVNTGRGGWEIPESSARWLFEQSKDGRGWLVFDHGWHQLAIAYWLFGPIKRIFAWIGETQVAPELAPDVMLDAPSTLVWEHDNGVRGVLDITLAPETYFKSDYYCCDERVEITGTRGYVRCNRVSSYGVQEPSVVVYRDGEVRGYHALPDRPPDAFAGSTANMVDAFRWTDVAPMMDGETSHVVLEALLTALESSKAGRPLDVPRRH
ncbi:MAG: Oxidoreductase domain protein [Actinomycetia bacterium]|nr:Oxidoreductase domain protein [Actinomycetes bacterium]